MSPAVVADFEQCLQTLVGTDMDDDQSIATLLAVASFQCSRAELRRTYGNSWTSFRRGMRPTGSGSAP